MSIEAKATTTLSFTEATKIVLDERMANGATISPNGKCFAFHPGSEVGYDTSQVFLLNLDSPLQKQLVLQTERVDAMRCLDQGLLVLHHPTPDYNQAEVLRINPESLEQTVILKSGVDTQIGDSFTGPLGSLHNSLTVDVEKPDQVFIFANWIGEDYDSQNHGFYKILGPNKLEPVFTKEGLGYAGFRNKTFFVAGNRVLFFAKVHAAPNEQWTLIELMRDTGNVTPLYTVGERRDDGRALTAMFAATQNYVTVTTASFGRLDIGGYPKVEGDAITHLLRLPKGELPSDFFRRVGASEEVMGRTVYRTYIPSIMVPEHSAWGVETAKTFPPNEDALWILEGNTSKKIIGASDEIAGEQVQYIGPAPISSRIGVMAMLPLKEEGNGYTADLVLVPFENNGVISCNQPQFSPENILNASSFTPGPLMPGTWTTIMGSCLAPPDSGQTILYVYGALVKPSFTSENQINILIPFHIPTEGNVSIVVVHLDADDAEVTRSAEVSVPTASRGANPGLFMSENGKFLISRNSDGSFINEDTPLVPGEVLVLWGTGFDQTSNVSATIGEVDVEVLCVGDTGNGLSQINIKVPEEGLDVGDNIITLSITIEEVRFVTTLPIQ